MLKGKNALVTGSTSGIGLAIADGLARAGANVLLNGFGDADQIERLRATMAATHGVKVAYHGADLAKPDQVAAMVTATEAQLGPVDILVNNAGIQHVADIGNFPAEKWDAVIAINLSAVFHATRAVLNGMRARGWGRIINIASAHGLVASVQKAAYVAAKHGVIGLTKVTALETATTGITCNAICPGWVLTPLVQKQIDALASRENLSPDAARDKLLGEKQPSRAFVTPAQLAEATLFLCSPATDQMRGAALVMDGGWTAQ